MTGPSRQNLTYRPAFAEALPDIEIETEIVQQGVARLPRGHLTKLVEGLKQCHTPPAPLCTELPSMTEFAHEFPLMPFLKLRIDIEREVPARLEPRPLREPLSLADAFGTWRSRAWFRRVPRRSGTPCRS